MPRCLLKLKSTPLTKNNMSKPITEGNMVAFKIEGIYVTARVTKVMDHNFERTGLLRYLVKTNEGHLHAVSQDDVLPVRTPEESEALIRTIAGLPSPDA